MKTINDLISDMQGYGLLINISNLKTNGRLIRCATSNKPRSKNGWYCIYESNNFINAVFGDHKQNNTIKWCSKQRLSSIEKNQIRANFKEYQKQAELARLNDLSTLRYHYSKHITPLVNSHPYIDNKGISEWLDMSISNKLGVDQFGNLIIPIQDINQSLMGYQKIALDGSKKFAKGSIKKGNFHTIIAEPLTITDCDYLFIGEGLATMVSTYIALNEYFDNKHYCCIVAFDVGNIESVLCVLLSKYPTKPITLIADNDHGAAFNVGVSTCNKIKAKYHDKPINIFIPSGH